MISVYDGTQLLEVRECRTVSLPDGRAGVIWRGLAYPVLEPDGRIDLNGEAFLPGSCELQEPRQPASRFAIIEGGEEAYVLLSGNAALCESVARALKAASYNVLRTGRYLGEAVAGVDADWFVRFIKPAQLDGSLEAALTDLLTRSFGPVAATAAETTDLRSRLLAAELSVARIREAELRAEIAKLKLVPAGPDGKAEADALRSALEEERQLRAAAETAALEVVTERPSLPVARSIVPSKLRDEIESVVAALLRRVRLIRDSLTVISAEFGSRRTLYRTLQELQETKDGRPSNWKKVKGVDGWWERHVSNGQDDSGRAYARWSGTNLQWEVLISHKGEQARDMAWLGRQ